MYDPQDTWNFLLDAEPVLADHFVNNPLWPGDCAQEIRFILTPEQLNDWTAAGLWYHW